MIAAATEVLFIQFVAVEFRDGYLWNGGRKLNRCRFASAEAAIAWAEDRRSNFRSLMS